MLEFYDRFSVSTQWVSPQSSPFRTDSPPSFPLVWGLEHVDFVLKEEEHGCWNFTLFTCFLHHLLEQLIANSFLIKDVLCIFVHSMAKFINLLSFFKVVPMVPKSHVLTQQITTVGYLLPNNGVVLKNDLPLDIFQHGIRARLWNAFGHDFLNWLSRFLHHKCTILQWFLNYESFVYLFMSDCMYGFCSQNLYHNLQN